MNTIVPSNLPKLVHPNRGIPAKLLHSLVEKEMSGKLIIQNPFDELVYWQVYLGKGRIHFANSANGSVERLNYLIGGTLNQRKITLPPYINSDYEYLCELWKKNIFSFQEIRSILTKSTEEALVQILSLPKAVYSFNPDEELNDIFLNLDLEKTIIPIKHKIRYWWGLRSNINSPFQRPLVENWDNLYQRLAESQLYGQHWIKRFQASLENLNCLYEIASKTETSTLQLALMLQPLVKTGEIKMLLYQEIQTDNRPLIICVDERPTYQRMVSYTLENGGFRTMVLDDPFKALTVLLNQRPIAIVINTDLPQMNGYQLSSFCRKSSQLKETPIILLGKRDNLLGKIRAKLSKASDYLSEPFSPKELLQAVNRLSPSRTIAIQKLCRNYLKTMSKFNFCPVQPFFFALLF